MLTDPKMGPQWRWDDGDPIQCTMTIRWDSKWQWDNGESKECAQIPKWGPIMAVGRWGAHTVHHDPKMGTPMEMG